MQQPLSDITKGSRAHPLYLLIEGMLLANGIHPSADGINFFLKAVLHAQGNAGSDLVHVREW